MDKTGKTRLGMESGGAVSSRLMSLLAFVMQLAVLLETLAVPNVSIQASPTPARKNGQS